MESNGNDVSSSPTAVATAANDTNVVNGKQDMGFRKLIVSHVENAATIYAYTEAQSAEIQERKDKLNVACAEAETPQMVALNQVYAAKIEGGGGGWIRGTVEQKNAGQKRDKLKIKALDAGSMHLVNPNDIRILPDSVNQENLPVLCLKYKMADLKPKGRDDGFSAHDRERGAEWLRAIIGGRTIKAKCHKVVNYKGGIMFDGEVNGHNLNVLALKQGFAKPNPDVITPSAAAVYGPPLHHHRPPTAAIHPGYAHQWDRDYFDYQHNGGQGGGGGGQKGQWNNKGGQQQQARPFLRQPFGQNNGGGKQQDPAQQVQKLKTTVISLESSLSKRNKEIASLKKQAAAGASGNSSSKDGFADLCDSIQVARCAQGGGGDTHVRIQEIVGQLSSTHAALKMMESEKLIEAERAAVMMIKCQDEVKNLVGKHAKKSPLHKAMMAAKEGVKKYVGDYLKLTNELDMMCGSLQNILDSEPLIQRPVIHQVDVSDKAKRNELVEGAVERAEIWAVAQAKVNLKDRSDESLESLCAGLEEMAATLRALNAGEQPPEDLTMVNVNALLKAAASDFGAEIKAKGSSGGSGDGSDPKEAEGLANVMSSLAKAISVCIHVKELLDKNLTRYNEVYNFAVQN